MKKKSINYLTTDGIKLLLEQPDHTTGNGRRNLALLALMYDTGARVQEIIDQMPESLKIESHHTQSGYSEKAENPVWFLLWKNKLSF